jgi:hypothetical protein
MEWPSAMPIASGPTEYQNVLGVPGRHSMLDNASGRRVWWVRFRVGGCGINFTLQQRAQFVGRCYAGRVRVFLTGIRNKKIGNSEIVRVISLICYW